MENLPSPVHISSDNNSQDWVRPNQEPGNLPGVPSGSRDPAFGLPFATFPDALAVAWSQAMWL